MKELIGGIFALLALTSFSFGLYFYHQFDPAFFKGVLFCMLGAVLLKAVYKLL